MVDVQLLSATRRAVQAFLIKLTSPIGPVFFVQERIGLRKRKIKVIKFRTMVPGAEQSLTVLERFNEASGPVFKIKNDPRVTFLGRFLRKTSIDELPQLFDVLKGDMSLVGPRPLPRRVQPRLASAPVQRQTRHHLSLADLRPSLPIPAL